MTYQFYKNISSEEYDAFVSNHTQCHLLQSSNWAKIKKNWDHAIVGIKDEHQQLIASAMVLIKCLPFQFTMLYIPRGPIMDYQNTELVTFFMSELKKMGRQKKALFMKIDPNIHLNDYKSSERNQNVHEQAMVCKHNLEACGGIHQGFSMNMHDTIQPRFQSNVYVVDDFMEQLPRHTKKLMKVALKRHVEVEVHGINMVETFYELSKKTEARQGISLRNEEYFRLLLDTYGDQAFIVLAKLPIKKALDNALIALSQVQKDIEECPQNAVKKLRSLNELKDSRVKEVEDLTLFRERDGDEAYIAGTLSIMFGNTCEILYAGTDDWYKKCMAQYLVWPHTMQYAFDHGCQSVNMGGVANTLDDGLTKFKDNFSPIINEFVGEFDFPVNKLLYKPAVWALRKRLQQ